MSSSSDPLLVESALREPHPSFGESSSRSSLEDIGGTGPLSIGTRQASLQAGITVPSSSGRGLLSGVALKTGYIPRNEFLDQVINRGVAAIFLFLAFPIFLIIIFLMKLTSPGPIFYRGERLGKDRVPFEILKFRTLYAARAKKLTADKTLPRDNSSETALGSYLRRSRLDELPQLINILRGEMVFFGPRPVRAEIEDLYDRSKRSHWVRFAVRPGLVGLAQAITTHGTPKSVRARFNYMCCKSHVNYWVMMGFVLYVGMCVLRRTVSEIARAISDMFSPLSEHKWLHVGFNSPRNARIEIREGASQGQGAVVGISEDVIQFVTVLPLKEGRFEAEIICRRRFHGHRRARAVVTVFKITPFGIGANGFVHYASYRTDSEVNRYFLERYLLQSSVLGV